MNNKAIKHSIQAALAADAYSLGAHWIYDWDRLDALQINWEELNAPQAKWHRSKQKGDHTHYGDHGLWLHQFVVEHGKFDVALYAEFWRNKMLSYTGYVDASSRETLKALERDPTCLIGSESSDLSIIGRIAPILLVSSNRKDFLGSVESFVKFTHNSPLVLKAAEFFANVLSDVVEGSDISQALINTKIDPILRDAFQKALDSKGLATSASIREFGPACGIEGAFEGSIHLLCTYDTYAEAIKANAKAGGDSAARGMLVGMLMGAAGHPIPDAWQ